MAQQQPLLVFPKATEAQRSKRTSPIGGMTIPEATGQGERIQPQFKRVVEAFERHRTSIQSSALGIEPEQVLVIETIGPVDNFANAVKKVSGLEWLVETGIDDIKPDFGFEDKEKPEKLLKGRLYLMMTDQAALVQFLSLFKQWKKNPDLKFPRGLAPLRNAFRHLHTIRPWEAEDRIRETGVLEDWREREQAGEAIIPFEAELWFRNDPARRAQAENYFRSVLSELGGEIASQCVVSGIRYHGILGRIPIQYASEILNRTDTRLLQCEDIMLLRPVGQSAFPLPAEKESESINTEASSESENFIFGPPVAALLDGLPLAGHNLLKDRIVIDDPDDYESAYQADERIHGTAMASLICHDELDRKAEALGRTIYVRPILKPTRDFHGRISESVPEDVLTVDLIHRAVIRMLEGEAGEPATAPEVRVINLSIGDRYKPLNREMSPLARLLDWLSFRFNVLFIVSAGNHGHTIQLTATRREFEQLSDEQKQEEILKAIVADTRHRKLLSPAETLNGISVGSLHEDFSGVFRGGTMQLDPYLRSGLISAFSAHGPGYRKTVKPEIFLAGGKQTLQELLSGGLDEPQRLAFTEFIRAPGQRVATANRSGNLNDSLYTRGTSNSTALATRACCQLFEVIENLRASGDGLIPAVFDPVLLKAMLVHGASWGDAFQFYERLLKDKTNSGTFKSYVSRFTGYGSINVARVLTCTDQRATVLGYGEISAEEGHEFEFPLPPSLISSKVNRRMTVTLAWFSPVSSSRQAYRMAHLWFDPKNGLAPERQECDHHAVQRGTIQHEILEGSRAFTYQDGDKIAIKVSCRPDAGDLPSPVKYAIAVTLEVAEGLNLKIYDEVKTRLKIPARQSINERVKTK